MDRAIADQNRDRYGEEEEESDEEDSTKTKSGKAVKTGGIETENAEEGDDSDTGGTFLMLYFQLNFVTIGLLYF